MPNKYQWLEIQMTLEKAGVFVSVARLSEWKNSRLKEAVLWATEKPRKKLPLFLEPFYRPGLY
jgi:hypothetical protein